MKLWLVERLDEQQIWDAHLGHVIQAADELSARVLASQAAADEGPSCWLDPERARCEHIGEGPDDHGGIILSSFMAG